jgi:hypothetical protein
MGNVGKISDTYYGVRLCIIERRHGLVKAGRYGVGLHKLKVSIPTSTIKREYRQFRREVTPVDIPRWKGNYPVYRIGLG